MADGGEDHDSPTCFHHDPVRTANGIMATTATIALIYATYLNLTNKARLRYPGRLVTCLGFGLILVSITLAVGLPFKFKQMDWDKGGSYKDHGNYDTLDPEERMWKHICVVQGGVFETGLLLIALYSAWICFAFFSVIGKRFQFQKMRRDIQDSTKQETLIHIVIVLGSIAAGFAAVLKGEVGWDTGVAACWVESRSAQLSYYYGIMGLSLGTGVMFSVISTCRLWDILKSVGPERLWSEKHRPLRRVVYGNIFWTIGVVLASCVPILDFIIGGNLLCVLANLFLNGLGWVYVLCFSILPVYLERCLESSKADMAERKTERNTGSTPSDPTSDTSGLNMSGSTIGGYAVVDDDDIALSSGHSSNPSSHSGSRHSAKPTCVSCDSDLADAMESSDELKLGASLGSIKEEKPSASTLGELGLSSMSAHSLSEPLISFERLTTRV